MTNYERPKSRKITVWKSNTKSLQYHFNFYFHVMPNIKLYMGLKDTVVGKTSN